MIESYGSAYRSSRASRPSTSCGRTGRDQVTIETEVLLVVMLLVVMLMLMIVSDEGVIEKVEKQGDDDRGCQ